MKSIILTTAMILMFAGVAIAGFGVTSEELNWIASPNQENTPTITTQVPVMENYGFFEMEPAEFETLISDTDDDTPVEVSNTVDIGTGQMPEDEFRALQCAVGSKMC